MKLALSYALRVGGGRFPHHSKPTSGESPKPDLFGEQVVALRRSGSS